jgi:predicted nucleotidyltransferase
MIFSEPYVRLYEALGKSIFTIKDAGSVLKSTYKSTKVIISRLKGSNQVFLVGHGRYILISPESYVKLQSIKKHRKLYNLTIKIFQNFPNLKMLILYGSQVFGKRDKYSDYDVLLILPERPENWKELVHELEKDIKLHMTVYSEQAYKFLLISEPYLKFWLNEGLIFDESGLLSKTSPPTAKTAYFENLLTAENYLNLAKKESDSLKRAKYCLTVLEILLMIENSLNLSYDFNRVKKEIEKLFGSQLLSAIRLKSTIQTSTSLKAVEIAFKKYGEVRKMLSLIGENESDLYWKQVVKAR